MNLLFTTRVMIRMPAMRGCALNRDACDAMRAIGWVDSATLLSFLAAHQQLMR